MGCRVWLLMVGENGPAPLRSSRGELMSSLLYAV